MQLLKRHAAPLVEQALESLGVDPSLVERMLQPAREAGQGDLSLPCFPFAKPWAWPLRTLHNRFAMR